LIFGLITLVGIKGKRLPELNKQETLWRIMRYEETTNTYYESFDELEIAVFKRSQSWKPKKVLSSCHLN